MTFDFDFWVLVKYGLTIFLGFYGIFAILILRQVGLMTETLGTSMTTPLKMVARFHLAFALSLFAISIFIL